MAFDSATVFAAQALPTPTDTPRQTPASRSSSRNGRRRRSSSPPSMPNTEESQHGEKGEAQDEGNGEEISPLDPRRFTPNLHASLVSQILTLQREVESRNKTVNNLEEFLHITRAENEHLNNSLKNEAKENRAIKKQMQLVESTTTTALGDIAKERGDAYENLIETRKRLETSKSRVRNQEEEAEKTQSRWDKERQLWDMQKRNMETKVKLAEGRLKAVLAEVAAAQANGHEYTNNSAEFDEGAYGTWYTKGSDSISSRSNSVKKQSRFSGLSSATNEVSEYSDFAASPLSGLKRLGGKRPIALSLADELNLSGDEHDHEGEGADDMTSPDALPEEAYFPRRQASVKSISQDQKAWKLLGLLPETIEDTIREEGLTEKIAAALEDKATLAENSFLTEEEATCRTKTMAAQYMDSATQFSPPISPKLPPQSNDASSEKVTERASIIEHIANQSRKRVSAPLVEQTMPKEVSKLIAPMVSAACQTVEQPPSPPLTPRIAIEPPASASAYADKVTAMTSSSMQTEDHEPTAIVCVGTREKPSSMTIPVIEIHPPGSRPASSHNSVVLPPRTKNVGCQVAIELPVFSRSISVQTEAVISGKLPVERPPRSMPKSASQSSMSQSGLERIEERSPQAPQQALRRSPRKNIRRPPTENSRPRIKPSYSAPVLDTYPGNNDSGPLTSRQPIGLRRPIRNGSLFAGFDSAFTDNTSELKDFDLSSDDDLATVAPIRKTLSKVQNSWRLVPRSEDGYSGRLESATNSIDNLDIDKSSESWLASLASFGGKEHVTAKGNGEVTSKEDPGSSRTNKQPSMRQAASQATAPGPSVQRARSPSAPSLTKRDLNTVVPPPFAVPTRSSSRRVPISASEGAQSPTPQTTTFFSTTRKREAGRPPLGNPLRKVRSAAAVNCIGRSNGQTRTPPRPTSPSTFASDSPPIPSMPKKDITARDKMDTQHVLKTTHAIPPASLSEEALIETPGQSTSVVDAIAQTMVGEWMWKYVRKRRSFGITDNVDFDENGNSNGSGIRHKRWVWLAPYERAVMWSSKQPTSGPALMGKNGRKCKLSDHHTEPFLTGMSVNIQSVLDVKDDAPIPKNSNSQTRFGRSILILTPQRALKFTATTRDRHYVWLTALSFLSGSPLGMDDLATVPPVPQTENQRPASRSASGGLRRSSIRDSIRVAKSKERPAMGGHAYSSPITSLQHQAIECVGMPAVTDDIESDAAEAPSIPRTATHTRTHARKRSNTGPRPAPPNNFHSFPAGAVNASTRSLKNPNPHDYSALSTQDLGAPAPGNAHDTISRHHSQVVHDPMPPIRNNFFDAVGTVRMEAFVEGKEIRGKKVPKKTPPAGNRWAKKPGKKDLRYWGVGGERTTGGSGPEKGSEDPFLSF